MRTRHFISIAAVALALALSGVSLGAQTRTPTPHRDPRIPTERSGRNYPGRDMGYPRRPVNLAPRDFYWGLDIGMTISRIKSDEEFFVARKVYNGMYAGLYGATPIYPGFPLCLQSGLYFIQKGGQQRYGDVSFNLNYIEVPALIRYRGIFDYGSIQPYAGFYFAEGVGGKVRDYAVSRAYAPFGDGYFRRFDSGLRVGCAMQFAFIYLEAGYDLGFVNIGYDDFNYTRNRTAFLNIGFSF